MDGRKSPVGGCSKTGRKLNSGNAIADGVMNRSVMAVVMENRKGGYWYQRN
jgi:hypothetical protein